MDVIALTEGLGKVLASVLQVRQGKVVDHVKLTMENEMEQSLNEVLPEFLHQFYVPGVFVPDEVLVSAELRPAEDLAPWLSRLKEAPVRVQGAEGGWRTELISMSEKNVLEALKEDIQQTSVLEDLKKLLNLRRVPRTIAFFDISTLQGTFTVGSAILFRDGVPEKSRYRKFKIKEVQ